MNDNQFETSEVALDRVEVIETKNKKTPRFDLKIESQTINLDIKSVHAQVADSFITQILGQIFYATTPSEVFYANSPSKEITIKLSRSIDSSIETQSK